MNLYSKLIRYESSKEVYLILKAIYFSFPTKNNVMAPGPK